MTVDSLQEPTAPHTEALTPSAGTLLRGYRESLGIKPDALASKLHVPVGKLLALEQDRLDALPDAMFARALALAVCRQLERDAAPVLARLPAQDVSRLATHNERGLDFPLKRPSLLPASGLRALLELPLWQRVLGLLLLLALFMAVNPWGAGAPGDAQGPSSSVVLPVTQVVVPLSGPTTGAPTPGEAPVSSSVPETTASPVVAPPPVTKPGAMVLTPVQPSPVVLTPVSPAAASEGASK